MKHSHIDMSKYRPILTDEFLESLKKVNDDIFKSLTVFKEYRPVNRKRFSKKCNCCIY